MVSGNKFKYEKVWSIIESLANVSHHRFGCRERDPKPSRRNSFCQKVNSATERGNWARGYQENWTWLPRRDKWPSNIWPFQPSLVLLGGTKHKSHNCINFLIRIEYLNWIVRHAGNEFQYRKNIHEIYLEKRKVCVSRQEVKTLFWRATSMIRTNHTYILVKGTRAKFYFQQIWPLGFPLGNCWTLADNLFDRQLVTIAKLANDFLIDFTKTKFLEKRNKYRDKTWLHVLGENLSQLGFQCKEPNRKSFLQELLSNKHALTTWLIKYSRWFQDTISTTEKYGA